MNSKLHKSHVSWTIQEIRCRLIILRLIKDLQYMDSNPMPSLKSKAQSERQHVIDAVSHAWEKVPSHVIISGFVKSYIQRHNLKVVFD